MKSYLIRPIGYVKKIDNIHYLEIHEEYIDGIYRLDQISHVFVLWWIHENDTPEARRTRITMPRVKNAMVTPEQMGTFATRSPQRPNPIGLSLVKILNIELNKIFIDYIDAFEDTPIIDIKPYLPNGDRIDEQIRLPPWFQHLLRSRPADLQSEIFPRKNDN